MVHHVHIAGEGGFVLFLSRGTIKDKPRTGEMDGASLTRWALRLECGDGWQEDHDPRVSPSFKVRYCHRCAKVVDVATARQTG